MLLSTLFNTTWLIVYIVQIASNVVFFFFFFFFWLASRFLSHKLIYLYTPLFFCCAKFLSKCEKFNFKRKYSVLIFSFSGKKIPKFQKNQKNHHIWTLIFTLVAFF
jgi:hypothetical protein